MRARRLLDNTLSEGKGRQLVFLTLLVLVVLLFLFFVAWLFGDMKWQEVLSIYMGRYNGPGKHDAFRIIIALFGTILFTGILVPVFVNIIGNVSGAYKRGDNRYRFAGHILIIGAARQLPRMLEAIRKHPELSRKEVLVMTTAEVAPLRAGILALLADKKYCRNITYYHCDRVTRTNLVDACADKASLIYLIGEENEASHDALNMKCLGLLREICAQPGPVIPCYVTAQMHTTLDIIRYVKGGDPSRLSVDVINESDYTVEQLLVHSELLPAITPEEEGKSVRIVIAGDSSVARAFAVTAAQICHYPNFKGASTRTKIVFLAKDMRKMMENFVSNHVGMFELCHYSYVSPDSVQAFAPREEMGDFMDLEWTFVDAGPASPFARKLLEDWAGNPDEKLVFAVCSENDDVNLSAATHLPRAVYESDAPILVYQQGDQTMVTEAANTGMFGRLIPFGEGAPGTDALYLRRTTCGKRVNRVYDLEYGNPPAPDADAAWKDLPQAHKLSSIASANFMPMLLRCFGLEPRKEVFDALTDAQLAAVSEVEHRRWMSSVLMLGYFPAVKEMRSDREHFKYLKNEKFIHLDIAPFDELLHDQEKDTLLMCNIPYIINPS